MPSTTWTVGVSLRQLLDAGLPVDLLPDGPFRVVARYEPETDGANAVGFYLQSFDAGAWADIEPWAASADEAMGVIRSLERAAHMANHAGLCAWVTEWGAVIE